jgi:hypothetical protein
MELNANENYSEELALTNAELDKVAGGFVLTIGKVRIQSSQQETTDAYIRNHTK